MNAVATNRPANCYPAPPHDVSSRVPLQFVLTARASTGFLLHTGRQVLQQHGQVMKTLRLNIQTAFALGKALLNDATD